MAITDLRTSCVVSGLPIKETMMPVSMSVLFFRFIITQTRFNLFSLVSDCGKEFKTKEND